MTNPPVPTPDGGAPPADGLPVFAPEARARLVRALARVLREERALHARTGALRALR